MPVKTVVVVELTDKSVRAYAGRRDVALLADGGEQVAAALVAAVDKAGVDRRASARVRVGLLRVNASSVDAVKIVAFGDSFRGVR